MKKYWSAALAVAICSVSYADTLTNLKTASCAVASDCNISGINLTGSLTAIIKDGGQVRKADLKLFGAGLRSKVLVLSFPVYVAQFYVTDASRMDRSDKILDSIDSQEVVAMTLTFRHDVDGTQIQSAFQDAFGSNGIDVTSDQISKLLDAALNAGVTKSGKMMTFVGEKLADGTTAVTFEGAKGGPVTIHGNKDFVRETMALWLGDTSSEEKELQKLKVELLRDRKAN